MQGTNESGGAYGEDPYGGAGHTYAYGHENGGGAPTDTATMSWDPVEPAQRTHPQGDPQVMEAYARAIGMPQYVAEPVPVTSPWGSPHGDVPIGLPPEFDTSEYPVPESDTSADESARPVFVDSSGRRRRRVRRAAGLLMIPAGGYFALLISTMLGGPGISAPFVPQPDSTHRTPPRAAVPDSSSGTGHSAGSPSPTAARQNSRSAVPHTPGATARPAASLTATVTSEPTEAPTATTSPTSTTPSAHVPKGRALGSSHRPVK
ncbi:hypothetical protein ABZ357_13705 [Streptomyces sp. NPDC005917]|uniref:hypothetical protein n=1 Tax=unclassified Streptomyces TaxID=2593676 RepID=UPI0033ED6633